MHNKMSVHHSDKVLQLPSRAQALVNKIDYLNYRFRIVESPRGEIYLCATYMDEDIYTKVPEMQTTRKWLLSPDMTDSEIVQTAFKLCITSAEHRCREAFRYKDARIFGPHFDVEDLVRICDRGREAAGGRNSAGK